MWTQPELKKFVAALEAGEVVAAPAEGVYGYCADPFNPQALTRLMALKQRDTRKGFILLVPDVAALAEICTPLDETAQAAAATYWQPDQPPTTLILPPLPTVPSALMGGFSTIAVRMPQVAYVREYLKAWGRPLVSTSLNVSGEAPAVTVADLPAAMVRLALPDPLNGHPSRIYDPVSGKFMR